MPLNNLIKPRLLLLSDIWGKTNLEWLNYYIENLAHHFDIQFYDVCELAKIDRTKFTSEEVHQKFIEDGIARALDRILEKEIEEVILVGFSIGGLIAWKASLSGLKTRHLFAISSTRLRYEDEKPKCKINLLYGERDKFAPDNQWLQKVEIEPEIYSNSEHEFYREKPVATHICGQILKAVL